MQRHHAPYRADVVGSFLRPDAIKQARLKFASGEIDAGQLRAVEDEAIRHVVEQQCACGLHVVTDGEFRRAWWHFDFFDGLQGVERYDSQQGIQFNGVQTKAHGVRVTGKLGFGDHPMLEDFRYLKSISGNAQPKMTIPSPSVLHFRGGRKDIDATVYPDLKDYFDDLATTWRDAIRAFYDAGCRYLQLDDTVWAYLCSDDQRRQIRERGDDADELARIYARVLNKALEASRTISPSGCMSVAATSVQPGFPKGAMSRWLKCCSGRSTWMPFSLSTTMTGAVILRHCVLFARASSRWCSVLSPLKMASWRTRKGEGASGGGGEIRG